MAKSLFIDPAEERQPGKISFQDISLNQYQNDPEQEQDNYSQQELLGIYRDMKLIREFESMWQQLKNNNQYRGIEYQYMGPAHLYFGQEAAAVGQAFLLDENDFIFGTHRSHGEILAKGLSAINKLEEQELMSIMESTFDGELLEIVKEDQETTKELAIDFFVYGIMAEIFCKEKGFARGLGNSMHAFFTPFGIYPNNAIVGGSAPIAVGAALNKKINQKPGIIVANLGDGSLGCGPVWEAMNMAAMGQYQKLWEDEYQGNPPILFNFFNNQYGMGGQTAGETMAYDVLARVGASINPEQMHTERIDGYNPLAVIDAVDRKRKLLENGEGPVLLDVLTYRLGGHSTSDTNAYRSREEIKAWKKRDPVHSFREQLEQIDMDPDRLDGIDTWVEQTIFNLFKKSLDEKTTPRMDLEQNPRAIEQYMFSDNKRPRLDDREPEVLIPREENPRIQQIKRKKRYLKPGEKAGLKTLQLRDALFEGILDKFYEDPTLIAYGEDNRDWGGAFGVYRDLDKSLPYHRLFNAPISEAAIVGSAVGYAMLGGRALIELMYSDFIGRAGDEIFNQLAKWQAMSAGQLEMPVVLRVSVGFKYGAQHSQDWSSLTSHVPGLKVVFPVTPYDAKGLINTALSGTDPVVIFEDQRLYDKGERFHKDGVPEDYYEVEIGEPDIKKRGDDLTLLTLGGTLYMALETAAKLEQEHGLSTEVIDARSIVPFNYEKVIESVKKTGKIVITSNACERGSMINDFARNVGEMAFDYLDAPPVTVGARNWITPAYELDKFFFPQPEWIIDAVHQKILPLKNYQPTFDFSREEQLRRAQKGV